MIATEKDKLSDIKNLVSGDTDLTRICGIILYSDENPYVKKVLRDDDYWKSLDKLSGPRWPIFAIRPKERPINTYKRLPSNCSYDLYDIGGKPEDNLLYLSDFGIEDIKELPLFIAFMWDDEGVLRQVNVPIEGDDEKSVYKSLESIVDAISQAEKQIKPEYRGTVNVFREVKSSLGAIKFRRKAIKTNEVVKLIREILSLFS